MAIVVVDTSAWIEYFNQGHRVTADHVAAALKNQDVAIGDLIYCEVMQGVYRRSERDIISTTFHPLVRCEMVGFELAHKAADNYRLLRNKGITIRKTIDVIIGTFCVEYSFPLIHHDRDFDLMAPHIGLKVI